VLLERETTRFQSFFISTKHCGLFSFQSAFFGVVVGATVGRTIQQVFVKFLLPISGRETAL
jgi:hypothetical protein